MKKLRGAVATAGKTPLWTNSQIQVQGSVVTNGLVIIPHHFRLHPSGPSNVSSILIISYICMTKLEQQSVPVTKASGKTLNSVIFDYRF